MAREVIPASNRFAGSPTKLLGGAKLTRFTCRNEEAAELGINMLTEAQYRELQKVGEFDLKTSSWVATPEDVRALGGALFRDRRYGKVFVYHNGAESYFAARGFRGTLRVGAWRTPKWSRPRLESDRSWQGRTK